MKNPYKVKVWLKNSYLTCFLISLLDRNINRIVYLWETFSVHLVQLPYHFEVTQSQSTLLRALSSGLLNTDKSGTSTTSLESMLQYMITLTVKNFFLMTSPVAALYHSYTSCHWWSGRRDRHLFLCFYSPRSCREPPSLLFFILDNPSVLSLSS